MINRWLTFFRNYVANSYLCNRTIIMNKRINWDALGVTTSVICAIHCAVLPLFLTTLPMLGVNIIHNQFFETAMIFIALAVGIYSLSHGYKKHHRNILPIVLFSIGMLFLFAKQVWHDAELWLLLPAVVLIISGHFVNYRLSRETAH